MLPGLQLSGIAAVSLAAALAVAAGMNSLRAAGSALPRELAQERARLHEMRVHAHLERDARQLEITEAQSLAWQDYAGARVALARHESAPAGSTEVDTPDAGDVAAERARRSDALADATLRLQERLTPAQRSAFEQILRSRQEHHRAGECGHGAAYAAGLADAQDPAWLPYGSGRQTLGVWWMPEAAWCAAATESLEEVDQLLG